MEAVAICPAHNESGRVGNVVRTLVTSGVFRRVVVVDDGSTDGTAAEAETAGADVIRLMPNRGKGGAMLAGVRATTEPVVAFFDADLLCFRPQHAQKLVAPVANGSAVMACGLRDYAAWNEIQKALPTLTGERAVLRSVLESVPLQFWSGWAIEAAINEFAQRSGGNVVKIVLGGLCITPKWNKVDPQKGIEDGVNMLIDVLVAIRNAKEYPR